MWLISYTLNALNTIPIHCNNVSTYRNDRMFVVKKAEKVKWLVTEISSRMWPQVDVELNCIVSCHASTVAICRRLLIANRWRILGVVFDSFLYSFICSFIRLLTTVIVKLDSNVMKYKTKNLVVFFNLSPSLQLIWFIF